MSLRVTQLVQWDCTTDRTGWVGSSMPRSRYCAVKAPAPQQRQRQRPKRAKDTTAVVAGALKNINTTLSSFRRPGLSQWDMKTQKTGDYAYVVEKFCCRGSSLLQCCQMLFMIIQILQCPSILMFTKLAFVCFSVVCIVYSVYPAEPCIICSLKDRF